MDSNEGGAEQSGAVGMVFAEANAAAASAIAAQQPGAPPPRLWMLRMQLESLSWLWMMRQPSATVSRGAMRLDSAGCSTEQGRLAYQTLVLDAFVVCTKHGVFTSTDAASMRAVSKTLSDPIRFEFNQLQIRMVTIVSNTLQSVAHKATTGVKGISGSLNASSFVRVLGSVDGGIYGKNFFDAACGCGYPVLAAAFLGPKLGAQSGTGVDLIENLPVYSRIFMRG